MAHFDAQKNPDGSAWTIQVGPGLMEVVGVEDGSGDIAPMPSEITQAAAQWLGGPSQFRLALMIGDSLDCVRVARNGNCQVN